MDKTLLKSHTTTATSTPARHRELAAKRHANTVWTDEKIIKTAAAELLQPDPRLIAGILAAARNQ